MKKLLLFILSSVLYLGTHAQTEEQLKQLDSTRQFLATTDMVYPYLDTPPGYAGGDEKWRAYQRNSPVLKDAIRKAKEQNIQAGNYTVVVKFTVNADGSTGNFKTTNKPIGYGLEEAAVKFIRNSGKWVPANIEGENRKTDVHLPVHFRIAY